MQIPTSRGNVAIAALLLVAGIGVAAITFDTVRLRQNVAQVAQAPTATAKPTTLSKEDQEKITQECTKGYDYVVRFEKGKDDPVVKPTLNGKDVVSLEAGNQCKGLPEGVVIRDGRKCDNTWKDDLKCKIYVCTPKEVTIKNTEECWLLEDKNGAKFDLDREGLKNELGARIASNIEEATKEDPALAQRIASEAKNYGPETTESILNALGSENRRNELLNELDAAKENYDRAKAENQTALEALRQCNTNNQANIILNPSSYLSSSSCSAQQAAVDASKQDLANKEAAYKNLAAQAQPLKELQGGLNAGVGGEIKDSCDSYGCYAYPKDQAAADALAKKGFDCDQRSDGKGIACFRDADKGPVPNDQNCTFGSCGGNGGGNRDGNGGGGGQQQRGGGMGGLNPSQFMPLLAGLAQGFMQNQREPSCSISVSKKNIEKPGEPVTLSWQSQNAQAAYLSIGGQVGPSGSMTVNPQQTTTFSMQVIGYPQQQQQQQQYNPYGGYGGYGQQGQYVWNPQLGAYVYVQGQQQQQQQQNPYMQIGQTIGQLVGGGGGQQQAQCSTQVTVGGSGGGDGSVKAQISCQPKIADVGMQVGVSYACQGANTSKGDGFSTNGQLSGSAQIMVEAPVSGTTATYALTCSKEGVTDSAQCTLGVNKPMIALTSIPKNIKSGETATIGWVTGAIESCVISSPTNQQFTDANKDKAVPSGSAKTPPLTQTTKFVLNCTTKAGGSKSAEVSVEIGN